MNKNTENSKRIAKNTGMLYFRLILTILVSLYTARVVLNTLGIADFGIFNVVGGVISLFGFINSAMASSTQRFLVFELGRHNSEQLKKVFSLSLSIHILIAVIILILAETVGLWFLNSRMNIPIDRIEAARWIYQFMILSSVVSITQVPYNASVLAHERMNIYAYISIIEVLLRLVIVFILTWIQFDKLKLYSILTFFVSIIISILYRVYCNRNFVECKYKPFHDRILFKELIGYASWNLLGSSSKVIVNHGINILLNVFFGPIVNAARGIAFNLYASINAFVTQFQQAVNPQIVKSYASKETAFMTTLIFRSSKFSFLLLFILIAPVLLETDFILFIWLKTVPDYTANFCRLVLLDALIASFSGSLTTSAQATGNIRTYQLLVGGILLLNFPISYLFLKSGSEPTIVFIISVILTTIALFGRLFMLKRLISLDVRAYFKYVILRSAIPCIIAIAIPAIAIRYFEPSTQRFLLIISLSFISSLISIYFFALSNIERKFLRLQVQTVFNKIIR